MSPDELIERARRVLRLEREAVAGLEERVAGTGKEAFLAAVGILANCTGRVIVAGVGKSGHIGRKIAATLTSTGTPASFLHPVEGRHGDIGLVRPGDAAILISKSGDSEEVLSLLELLQRLGVQTIALVGDMRSPLARHSEVALDVSVAEEACPHNLAPTTSTTATLVLGDALAIVLLELKGFRAEDFARLHPGGALGRRLLTRVADVMLSDGLPLLGMSARMRDAIVPLAEKRGIAIIVDEGGRLAGVITAGDLTRTMERVEDVLAVPVTEVMTRTPKSCTSDELGSAVVFRMETHGIMAMPVLNGSGAIVGVVHLHDLMRAGAA